MGAVATGHLYVVEPRPVLAGDVAGTEGVLTAPGAWSGERAKIASCTSLGVQASNVKVFGSQWL